jgi:hypothetical protein
MSIDFKNLSSPFRLSELDWRILQAGKQSNGEPWGVCAAYVDARAIMNRLDEVVGPQNWQTEFQQMGSGTLCTIKILCGGVWVSKQDGSDETDTEPFKGGISKSLVRAAVSWGIGRYLYDLPQQWAFFGDTNKKTPGNKHIKFKDGSEGYWLPPHKLPDWATHEDDKLKEPKKGLAAVPNSPEKPVTTAVQDCPTCHGKMMVSKYPNKVTGEFDFYCSKCKKSVPRTA